MSSMVCKSCKVEYSADPEKDVGALHGTFDIYNGWHPMFGDCWWCYSWNTFGWRMQPWGDAAEREKQVYTITPPGISSPPVYPNAEAEIDQIVAEMEWPEDYSGIMETPF